MRMLILAVLLATAAAGLGACNYVEQFYASQCTQWGGTWNGADGCAGQVF